MGSLGELLNQETVSRLLSEMKTPGNVYGLTLDEDNGITPHAGETERYKFFVILGKDAEGNIYGGVVINSHINQNLPPKLKDLHYPISCVKYPFLSYNSFVNCVTLVVVSEDTLSKGKPLGQISDEDLQYVKATIVSGGIIPKARLKQFGLL